MGNGEQSRVWSYRGDYSGEHLAGSHNKFLLSCVRDRPVRMGTTFNPKYGPQAAAIFIAIIAWVQIDTRGCPVPHACLANRHAFPIENPSSRLAGLVV